MSNRLTIVIGVVVYRFIWQSPKWPQLEFDSARLLTPLGKSREALGQLRAVAEKFNLALQARVLEEDVLHTASIEGERLDPPTVRSSVARQLGLEFSGLPTPVRDVDGLVQMLRDATENHAVTLSAARLKGWHAALFPTGYSGFNKIAVAKWRSESAGTMQVVSGRPDKEQVHFQAPPANRVSREMKAFLAWWNKPDGLDWILRAGLAHLRFVTIHPFEDGNGRIARALSDMALARAETTGLRLYSMSAQISSERKNYYDALKITRGDHVDVTDWLVWFFQCHERAVRRSLQLVDSVLQKERFWLRFANMELNARQKKVITRLLDSGKEGFEGGLTSRKYRGMTKASPATATRDITDLLLKGLIVKNPGGGRSANYRIAWSDD